MTPEECIAAIDGHLNAGTHPNGVLLEQLKRHILTLMAMGAVESVELRDDAGEPVEEPKKKRK